MKNLLRALLVPFVVLCALSPAAHAQTVFNAIGSSALFLEFGEAAYANSTSSCAWSTGTNGVVVATDTSTGSSLTDTGSSWVVWVPAVGNTCATDATPAKVYGYLQTDSVVGNRCLFNAQETGGPFCSISYAGGAGTSPAGKIEGSNEVTLPASVASSLTGAKVNAAGTDIRPEDAEFAITRALTPCGSTTTLTSGSIAPYLGLGYTNGEDIDSFYSSSKFHAINFTLPSTFYVQPVGVDPILVVINSTDAAGTGFNNSAFRTISRNTLAQYLDGSIGSTAALGGTDVAKPATVIIREPLSGTYNTMEYNVPNTVANQTSQDVGALQLASQRNCSGTVPASNPLAIENTTEGSWRYRAIGTSQELAETFATNDALGYGFWGVSNFAAAPASARYLMVDGYDPLLAYYGSNGVIPTTSTELGQITFTQVSAGNYPVWSLIRVVTVDTATNAIAKTLAISAASFSGSSHPDFLPYYTIKGAANLGIERSHFAPPGIHFPSSGTNQPANHGYVNTYGACTAQEAGGDVGGVVIQHIVATDQEYCHETGTPYGIINRRN